MFCSSVLVQVRNHSGLRQDSQPHQAAVNPTTLGQTAGCTSSHCAQSGRRQYEDSASCLRLTELASLAGQRAKVKHRNHSPSVAMSGLSLERKMPRYLTVAGGGAARTRRAACRQRGRRDRAGKDSGVSAQAVRATRCSTSDGASSASSRATSPASAPAGCGPWDHGIIALSSTRSHASLTEDPRGTSECSPKRQLPPLPQPCDIATAAVVQVYPVP